MNIYIDTNILLSFYHFTSEDLEELKKLVVLIQQKKATLILPQQTRDEFYRNRASKIADGLKKLKEQKFALQIPAMCKDYKSYDQLRSILKESEKLHTQLLDEVQKDIDGSDLKADKLVTQLFEFATVIPITDDVVKNARLRMDVGNPPGKSGSLGDAINWEAIQTIIKDGEDLYFVGGDKDYRSALDDRRFNEFLVAEWSAAKKSRVHFYKMLSDFFKDRFPDIKLAAELEKEALIMKLAASRSFTNTHVVIASLANVGEFTAAQANNIVTAATTNNQVYWIAHDPDVSEFLSGIIAKHEAKIDPEGLAALKSLLKNDEKKD